VIRRTIQSPVHGPLKANKKSKLSGKRGDRSRPVVSGASQFGGHVKERSAVVIGNDSLMTENMLASSLIAATIVKLRWMEEERFTETYETWYGYPF